MLRRLAEQPGVGEVAHELRRHPGGVDQLVVVVGRLLRADEETGERARIVVIEERVDGGEREPPRLQRTDALELVEVLGPEAPRAPAALAAREQALALVVADGVDRDAGPLGQLVDAPVAHDRRTFPPRGGRRSGYLTKATTE